MKDSIESQAKIKDPATATEIDLILNRLDELESRCIKFETTLNDTDTFN